MKTVYMCGPRDVSTIEVPSPELRPGDILIRVQRVGLCGTDLHSYRGSMALTRYPVIPGHEMGGYVLAVGAEVPEGLFAEGDRVTVKPYFNCGACYPCRIGRINCCKNSRTMGVQMREGAMSDYVSVPYDHVFKCGDLSYEEIALIEPLAVGAHLANRAGIAAGENVLVYGCGLIGLGAIAAAYFAGANVIAVDIADEKFETAAAMGAKACINSRKQDLEREVERLTNGVGLAAVLEAVGLGETMAQAVELVNFAGRVGLIGYGKGDFPVDENKIVQKELDIIGARNAVTEEFLAVIENMTSRKLDFSKLVSAVYPAEKAKDAFEDWDKNPDRFVKIQIQF